MANNALIGALRAEATLESGKFVDGAKKIRKEAKATETQVKSSFSAMGAAVKGFGGALTAGLSIGLLGAMAKKALDFATAIKDVAAQVGVTTKELQEFRYAAAQMGIKQAEADKGLEKLNVTMGKAAAGSVTAQKALAAVGVSLVDVKTKSNTQIFGQIADQMIKQGGAAKNAAAANAVFGEGASKLNPLLDKGSKGINELAQAAQRLGVVLSDSAIQNADETARKLDDVKQVLAAQISGVVADNASSIVSLAQALSTLTSSIVNFMGSNPQAALAIIGALAGSRFGLPGAAAGAIGGAVLGRGAQAEADQRSLQGNTGLLRHNLQQQIASIKGKRASGQPVKQSDLNRLTNLENKLRAATGNTITPRFSSGSVPDFLAPAGSKGSQGRKAPRAPRDRSDDVSFQFDQELRRAQIDVLRAQQGLARTSEERAKIALQLLDAERQTQEAELNDRVRRAERDLAEGKITAGTLEQVKAQAEKLRAEYDSADALQRKAIADELAADKAEDAAALVDADYDLRLEKLQLEAALAEETGERLDVELRILALAKEQERARLETVIADKNASETAKEIAKARLAELDAIYAGREDAARQGNRSPLQDYKAQWGNIDMENEQALVGYLEDMADALSKVTDGWKDFKKASLDALKSLFQTLLKNQLNQLFASLIPAGGVRLPGFATGGSIMVGGRPGVDKNILQLNGMPIARVSYGERVNVSNDNGRNTYGSRGDTHVHVNGVRDFDSFRRNERQTGRAARRVLGIPQ